MSEKWDPLRGGGPKGSSAQIRERLRKKTTEDLLEELDSIIENSTDFDLDVGLVDEYLKIIREREKMPEFDTETSLFRFWSKHRDLLEVVEPAEQQSSVSNSRTKGHRCRQSISVVLMVAALLAIMILGACEYVKFFFRTEAEWTEEGFRHRVTQVWGERAIPPEEAEVKTFTTLEEALDYCEMTADSIPEWFSVAAEFCEAKVSETSEEIKLIANYRDGEDYIGLTIRRYKHERPLDLGKAEKDSSIVDERVLNGVHYYVMENIERVKVTWVVGLEMYTIASDLTTEEVIKMIELIDEGEDDS